MPFLATMRPVLILIAVVGPAACANKLFKAPFPPYTVVNCCDSRGMTVFPFDGTAFNIPLPFVPFPVAFAPKGNALYAVKPGGSGIVKIEFHPTRVSPVWESLDLAIINLAVSVREDKLVIAGRPRGRPAMTCGLFEISLPGKKVSRIREEPDCRVGAPWQQISLSSDGERAVANVGSDLQLIDLVHGTVKSLGSEFSKGKWSSGAAWSPDGKRIAVMESADRGTVFLLDPNDLSPQRALHGGYRRMTPVWSPDSRY